MTPVNQFLVFLLEGPTALSVVATAPLVGVSARATGIMLHGLGVRRFIPYLVHDLLSGGVQESELILSESIGLISGPGPILAC